MSKCFQVLAVAALLAGVSGCAAPAAKPEQPAAPKEASPNDYSPPFTSAEAPVAAVGAAVGLVRGSHAAKAAETRAVTGSITIDCSVKLPDDPTDNPELCRSFQMSVVDETGAEATRFRFGNDARYRFAGKPGKHYRIKPLIGSNWAFTADPDRDLAVGEHVRVQLRQKQ
jgi:hypothetical protein